MHRPAASKLAWQALAVLVPERPAHRLRLLEAAAQVDERVLRGERLHARAAPRGSVPPWQSMQRKAPSARPRDAGRRVPRGERGRGPRVVVAADLCVQRSARAHVTSVAEVVVLLQMIRHAPSPPRRATQPEQRRRSDRHGPGRPIRRRRRVLCRAAACRRGGSVQGSRSQIGTARRLDLARQPLRRRGRRSSRSASRRGATRALWIPEAVGRDPFACSATWPRARAGCVLATGIANIYARDADDHARHPADAGGALGRPLRARARRLARAPGQRGARARLPEAGRDHARLPRGDGEGALHGAEGRARRRRSCWRRCARRCSSWRREKARGAHPYFVPPEHTARAREILGHGPLAVPRADGAAARPTRRRRARSRAAHDRSTSRCPNYQNNLKRLGFSDADFADGGSDRLVDAIVAWGDEKAIAARIQAHHDAGADHVCIQPFRPDGQPGPDLRVLEALAPRAGRAGMPARRSFWGWGARGRRTDRGAGARASAARSRRASAQPRAARRAGAASRADRAAATARLAARRRSRSCSRTSPSTAPPTPTASRYRDIVRGARGDFAHPPDLVAFPRDEADVVALLDWCADARLAAIPYGGGSSVVGGVEAACLGDLRGAVSIDLAKLDRVLEIDRVSRAARIQAGILGPALEDQLRPHGLTLRHFPQSFEFSTPRRLDRHPLRRALRDALHPHRRLRRSAARGDTDGDRRDAPPARLGRGPEPRPPLDRLRGNARHHHRGAGCGSRSGRASARRRACASRARRASCAAAQAVRALSQSGLHPANCRLLDRAARRRTRAPAPATPPCWCSASSRPTTRSTPGWRARSSSAATRAAQVPEGAGATRSGEEGAARGRRRRLAQRLPQRALPARRARARRRDLARPSRRRSPGTASRRSTRR